MNEIDNKKQNEEYQACVDNASIYLQTGLNNIIDAMPFIGTVLSILDISFVNTIQTAGVYIDPVCIQWKLVINPKFFCSLKSQKEREAVLIHEIYHIISGHLTRVPYAILDKKSRKKMNMAADCAINQFIPNLPPDCVDVKKMRIRKPDGTSVLFPKEKSMEEYYSMWPDIKDDQTENGIGVLDDHTKWDEVSGSVSETEALKATDQIIERSIQKSSCSHSNLPNCIKDYLKYSESRRKELNYRAMLLMAFKRSLSGYDRTQTWNRQSRRYGKYAKGTKSGQIPKLHIFGDTSGSISITEFNEFLGIVKSFIKVSSNPCLMSMFHTNVYGTRKIKQSTKIKEGDLESGGTDLTPVMKEISKRQPELTVILTDGYYENVNYEKMIPRGTKWPTTIFLISKDGDENHPLKRCGKTIKIPK